MITQRHERTTTARLRATPLRAWWWRHPELPPLVVVGLAWLVLALDHWRDHTSDTPWSFGIAPWTLMVAAMMLPGLLPPIRKLSFGSLWRRRHRTAAIFAAAYVSIWIGFGVVAALVVALGQAATSSTFAPGTTAVVIALLVSAAWQLTRAKREFLFRCHLERPVAPRGRRGDRSLISYGWFHGRACVGSCWPIMIAMFVAAHDFHLMVPLAAITTTERFQRRPTFAASAAALLALAALAFISY